ncbi:MAG: hypothetical protein HY316_04005 [Acidobacteria bacterium]|nr:hypothetical protein [Acidobacteriota bacterium]
MALVVNGEVISGPITLVELLNLLFGHRASAGDGRPLSVEKIYYTAYYFPSYTKDDQDEKNPEDN